MKTVDRTEILKAIKRVPLLSTSASRLLQLSAEPEHDLVEIIDVVKCDSALTAHILRVVNSAAFGLLNPINSIDRALAYLGERIVVGIAIGDSASQIFENPLGGYEAQRGDLWRHDLRVAIASREIARHAKSDLRPDLAFTAGILHDIGKAVLSDFLKGASKDLIENIEKEEIIDFLDGEKKLLGMDHTQVGYEVAKNWKLPEPLQMAILHHHRPKEAAEEYRALVYSVHLGDIVAMMGGTATGADGLKYQMDTGYSPYIDLSSAQLDAIMLEVEEEYRKIQDSILESTENSLGKHTV